MVCEALTVLFLVGHNLAVCWCGALSILLFTKLDHHSECEPLPPPTHGKSCSTTIIKSEKQMRYNFRKHMHETQSFCVGGRSITNGGPLPNTI